MKYLQSDGNQITSIVAEKKNIMKNVKTLGFLDVFFNVQVEFL